jgi:hypothetical protein
MNPFLKRHVSSDQNVLTFNEADPRMQSPSGYSPINKKEILEQD